MIVGVLLVLAIALTVGWLLDVLRRRKQEESLASELEAKEDFAGYVAHELRSPMSIIASNTRLLDRGNLSLEERERSVAEIREAAGRLDNVVRTLLSLAEVEHSSGLEVEPILLQHIISRIENSYEQRAADRRFNLNVPDDLPVALGNPSAIELVIANLLSNAEKYGSRDQPIRIDARVGGRQIWVSVSNGGPRMSSRELNQLFEPYARDNARAVQPGMGLGLSLSERLIEAQGGRMAATAIPSGGARFSFSLPVLQEDAVDREATSTAS